MKKMIITHVLLTLLVVIVLAIIAYFSLQKIANAEDFCDMWDDKCTDTSYNYDNPFKNNQSNDIYGERNDKESALKERSNDGRFEASNTSRNPDKTISKTILRQLNER